MKKKTKGKRILRTKRSRFWLKSLLFLRAVLHLRKGKKTQVHAHAVSELAMVGFTIIELLVVISIMSLMSSIVLVSFNDNRAKARDAVKILNLKTIQNAIQLHMEKNGGIPPLTGPGIRDGITTTDLGSDFSLIPNFNALGRAIGIATMPHGRSYPLNFSIVDYYAYIGSYSRDDWIPRPGFCMHVRPYSYVLHVNLETNVGNKSGLAPGTGYYVLSGGPADVFVSDTCPPS